MVSINPPKEPTGKKAANVNRDLSGLNMALSWLKRDFKVSKKTLKYFYRNSQEIPQNHLRVMTKTLKSFFSDVKHFIFN